MRCLVYSRASVRIRVSIRFSVWLVSCYAHVFLLLQVGIVTDRKQSQVFCSQITPFRPNGRATFSVCVGIVRVSGLRHGTIAVVSSNLLAPTLQSCVVRRLTFWFAGQSDHRGLRNANSYHRRHWKLVGTPEEIHTRHNYCSILLLSAVIFTVPFTRREGRNIAPKPWFLETRNESKKRVEKYTNY